MAEVAAIQPKFTTIAYQTKDGENVSATKKDGVVTLVGDKNGTRQMELDKFVKEELTNNVKNIKLENAPEKDTVEISKPAATPEAAKAEAPKATEEAKATDKAIDVKTADVKPEIPVVTDAKKDDAAKPKKLDVVA